MAETPDRALKAQLKRYTQSEIARLAGVSPQHVCDVVKGRRKMWPALLEWLGFSRQWVRKAPGRGVE